MNNLNIRVRKRIALTTTTAGAAICLPPVAGGDLRIEYMRIDELKMPRRQTRRHPQRKLWLLAANLREFGFLVPIVVDCDGRVVTGVARVHAAPEAGLERIPVVRVTHLSESQLRAFTIADNRLTELSSWDDEVLALELGDLQDLNLNFELDLLGFDTPQLDIILGDRALVIGDRSVDPANDNVTGGGGVAANDDDDDVDLLTNAPTVSLRGDLWQMDEHLVLCGDARREDDYRTLMGAERAQMIFCDPPYNVAIDGNVCGLGSIRHEEFAMASGEMSTSEFTAFLGTSFARMAAYSTDGSIHFICMDWRHMREMLDAGYAVYTEMKNLIVWNKYVAGMGAFYRSKHELIFVWKSGTGTHINNFGLGGGGRYRTNVWDYPGITSAGRDRLELLAMHPTVKPVAMVADAIKDCSRRGGIILDPFCGSGTTILAAERTARVARAIEYEPKYVDASIRRWERATGKSATLVASGLDFASVAAQRADGRRAA